MDRLDGLKYEIRTECQRKNERKYGDIDKTLKDYKREDIPIIKKKEFYKEGPKQKWRNQLNLYKIMFQLNTLKAE